jgi:hypothetical protein
MLERPSMKPIDHRAIGERIAGKLRASPEPVVAEASKKAVQVRSFDPIGRRSPKLKLWLSIGRFACRVSA